MVSSGGAAQQRGTEGACGSSDNSQFVCCVIFHR